MSDTTSAAPFISDPAGSFAEDARAEPTSTINDTMDWFGGGRQIARGIARESVTYGQVGDIPGPTEETTPADVLQQKYSIPGKLSFDNPLPESVARSMYDTKREDMMRQAAIDRRPSGIISGGLRYGAQFMADLLDPVNIAATFVPGAPELELGASIGARVASRALQGAASGAVGMLPLSAIKYGLSRQEQSDYTAYNAMSDVAVGAGIGAFLHVGGGMLGDYLSSRVGNSPEGRVIQSSPEARMAMLKTSVAQLAEDRPVEIRPVLDAAMEHEPGGWGAFPEGEPLVPEHTPEPPENVTEPPTTEPEGATPGTNALVPEPREPQRLTSFIVGSGGLRDEGGDVRSSIGGVRGRPGLLNSRGMGLDDAAQLAWENGFFPGHGDQRPDINEFLNALDDDVKGLSPRYSHHNDVAVQNYQDARAQNSEVLRLATETGIPVEGRTPQQFFDAVASHLSEDDLDKRVGDVADQHQATYEEAETRAKEWVAHHGTPHDFDRFDASKIGTGEGAQAYGHGLYFAENEGVARSYRRKLADRALIEKVKDSYDESDSSEDAEEALFHNEDLTANERNLLEALKKDDWLGFEYPHQAVRAALREPDNFDLSPESRAAVEAFGHLYTVRIKAKPEEMLDWDKPLADQPESIKDAFRKAGLNDNEISFGKITGGNAYEALAERLRKPRESPEGWASVAGGPVRHDLQEHDPAAASNALHDGGIKGIRYLDRQSRTEGEGTHNLVVFDHNDVEITHKNGEPVEHHAPTEAEAKEISPHDANPQPAGFDAEQFYGKDQNRTLEDLERERQQEADSTAAGQRQGGDEQRSAPAGYQGSVQEGGGPGGRGAGASGRAGPEVTGDAVRAASGRREPTPPDIAADAALKEKPDGRVKLAEQQIADNEEFFSRAEAAGALTEDVRAELAAINDLDKEASGLAEGAMQAAACISRGLAGGAT